MPEATLLDIAEPDTEVTVLPVADPVAELPPAEKAPGPLSLSLWVANLLAVILPFLALGAAAVFFWAPRAAEGSA